MENVLQDALERYAIGPDRLNDISIYQSLSASEEQFAVNYVFSEYEEVYSSIYRGKKEFAVVGNHKLTTEGVNLYQKVLGED